MKGPDGKLHEKVFSKTDHVKDECKAQAIGPCAPKKHRRRPPPYASRRR